MRFYALLLALSGAAVSAQAKPVVDFSEDHQWQFTDKLYDYQEDQILKQLFPQYAKTSEACPEGVTAELVDNGIQVVRGSFSRAGADELVVTFKSSECPGSHAGEHGNIALVRNMKVIDARNDLSTAQFEAILDVDKDGASELITSAAYGNNGYFNTAAETVTFKGGHIQKSGYVSGVVHTEDCGAFENGGHVIDAVFFPNPARPGRTVQKNYTKGCEQDKSAYRFHSNGPLEGF